MSPPPPYVQPRFRSTMRPFAFSALLRLPRTALPWLAAVLAPSLFASPAYVTIGTGALNGVYYPTGGAISRLRRKLGDNPDNPTRIKTVRQKGYLFVPHAWE